MRPSRGGVAHTYQMLVGEMVLGFRMSSNATKNTNPIRLEKKKEKGEIVWFAKWKL